MGTDIHGMFQRLDIHGVFQRIVRVDKELIEELTGIKQGTEFDTFVTTEVDEVVWEDIRHNFDMDRDYQLFAVLAGVRNGFGFAGVTYGEAVKPIAEPRGLPSDFTVTNETGDSDYESDDAFWHVVKTLDVLPPFVKEIVTKYSKLQGLHHYFMGEHTHSWITSDEFIEWFNNVEDKVLRSGLLSRQQYIEWDKVSQPLMYCGDIWDRQAVKTYDSVLVREQSLEPKDGHLNNWTHVFVTWNGSLKKELRYFHDEIKRLHDLHGCIRFVFGFDS